MSGVHDERRHALLAIDSATSQVVIASGSRSGVSDGLTSWTAGHRHGETLLPSIERFLAEQDLRRSQLIAIVVGSGPGAFTGLRVAMATAKGMAHGLGIPLVTVSTAEALIAAAAEQAGIEPASVVLLLPAGPSDRIVVRTGQPPELLPGGVEPPLEATEQLVAVELAGRATEPALALGLAAQRGLGTMLLRLGADRLATVQRLDDGRGELATGVPAYVTLPRGAVPGDGAIAWSRDHR